MQKIVILNLLLSITLTSCGGGDSSKKPVDNTIRLPDRAALVDALEQSKVRCGEPGLDCPNNVAKLIFWERDGDEFNFGVCSGTVIEEDHILTNSHCIPDSLKTGSSCDAQILVQFPKTKTSRAENLNCISVVQVYDYNNSDQPDLAVLKIEKSKINNFDRVSIKKNDFQDKKKVHAYTMNPGGELNPYVGTIKRKDCNISFDSILKHSSSDTDKDFMISGKKCNVISGNSGSGLFNEQGQLIGAVHQKLDTVEAETLFTKSLIPFEKLTYIGMAVNYACLSSLTSASGFSCSSIKKELTLDEYISLKKKEFSLEHLDDSDIEAVITSNLSIRLSEGDDSLSPIRTLKWLRSRIGALGGSEAVRRILQNY